MVLELFVCLKALKDVVSRFEVFERTENNTFELRHCYETLIVTFHTQYLIQSLEPVLNHLSIFIP